MLLADTFGEAPSRAECLRLRAEVDADGDGIAAPTGQVAPTAELVSQEQLSSGWPSQLHAHLHALAPVGEQLLRRHLVRIIHLSR